MSLRLWVGTLWRAGELAERRRETGQDASRASPTQSSPAPAYLITWASCALS